MIDKYTYTKKEVLKSRIRTAIGRAQGNKDILSFGGKYSTWESL